MRLLAGKSSRGGFSSHVWVPHGMQNKRMTPICGSYNNFWPTPPDPAVIPGRFTREKVLAKKNNLLRTLMGFADCFSSCEGNQWLKSSNFWNKCMQYSVEVCRRLRVSTTSLPFSLVWVLCSGCPATHVGPNKTDWYKFRNIKFPVGVNRCQPHVHHSVSSLPRCNLENVSPESTPATDHQTANIFCKLILPGEDHNNVSKCGLKAGDYDVSRSQVTTNEHHHHHHHHHVASKKKRFKSSAISSGCSWFLSPAETSWVSPFYASLSLSLSFTPLPFYVRVIYNFLGCHKHPVLGKKPKIAPTRFKNWNGTVSFQCQSRMRAPKKTMIYT